MTVQIANKSFRNTELLKSASKYGKNLKTISVTGSINAITTGDAEDLKSRTLTSEAWNFVSRFHLFSAQPIQPVSPLTINRSRMKMPLKLKILTSLIVPPRSSPKRQFGITLSGKIPATALR